MLDASNSSYINSTSHRIIKNRQWMIIAPIAQIETKFQLIEGVGTIPFLEGELSISLHDISEIAKDLTNKNSENNKLSIEWLDANAIQFPLLLRPWAIGRLFLSIRNDKEEKSVQVLNRRKIK
jgi:tRNA(Ile)-lysidine synthase